MLNSLDFSSVQCRAGISQRAMAAVAPLSGRDALLKTVCLSAAVALVPRALLLLDFFLSSLPAPVKSARPRNVATNLIGLQNGNVISVTSDQ